MNLASALNHRLDTLGIVHLTLQIATQTSRTPFVVVRQLGADVILGAMYIDKHIEHISMRRQNLILSNGDVVPIIRRPGRIPIEQSYDEKLDVAVKKMRSTSITSVKWDMLQPGTQTPVLVRAKVDGNRVLEPVQEKASCHCERHYWYPRWSSFLHSCR